MIQYSETVYRSKVCRITDYQVYIFTCFQVNRLNWLTGSEV